MLRQIRQRLGQVRHWLARRRERAKLDQVVSIEVDGVSRGRVLLSYLLYPFLLDEGEAVPHDHTNYWESLQIAETFLELGYSVDVIDYRNMSFNPTRNYAFFIDIRFNMERLAPILNSDCVKISHHDTAHILFHNTAEQLRLLQLQRRRGMTLKPLQLEPTNLAIEHADYVTIIGNDFTLETYRYAGKPLFPLPVPSAVMYDSPENKDFDAVRVRFIWMGSWGLVHKGLDLLLDAFVRMPQYELYICGPIKQQREFAEAFDTELYNTPNIHTLDWVDVASDYFRELTHSCVGLVYASCSEGQAGAVITCMHAGLIPIVSRESGVDIDDDYGELLTECTVEEIMEAVNSIAQAPSDRLEKMSRCAWEHVRVNNTRENYARVYRSTMERIIEDCSA